MATARSGYTLQVIKAGQQGHVEMRWGISQTLIRGGGGYHAAYRAFFVLAGPAGDQPVADQCRQRHLGGASSPSLWGKRHPGFIEAELKKIVQIVGGYEAAEDTHIVE